MAIDLAVVVVVILAAGSMAQIVGLLFPRWPAIADVMRIAVGAFIPFAPVAYFTLTVAIAGRTLGKGLMGIRIVGPTGRPPSIVRSVARTLGYMVSLIPAGAGFWAVLLDRDRRAWHDHLAGSRVIHDPPRPSA